MSDKRPLCSALRAKGFYVYTEAPEPESDTQTAVFWCVKTQSAVGPDGDAVHKSCCDASRSCFEGPRS